MLLPDLLTRQQVLDIVGFSQATLYRHMAAGTFPRPVMITWRKIGWLESDIEDWIKAKVDARNDRP